VLNATAVKQPIFVSRHRFMVPRVTENVPKGQWNEPFVEAVRHDLRRCWADPRF
jgi:hypothetical protein